MSELGRQIRDNERKCIETLDKAWAAWAELMAECSRCRSKEGLAELDASRMRRLFEQLLAQREVIRMLLREESLLQAEAAQSA